MRNYNLGFISDEDIYNHVRETVLQYRQSISSLGYFHQNIFKYAGNGWKISQDGDFDLVNDSLHYYVKFLGNNKKKTAAERTNYIKMQDKVLRLRPNKSFCFIVDSFAPENYDEPYDITIKEKGYNLHISSPFIRHISIDKLYRLVFKDNRVYGKVVKALPNIIDDIIKH